MAKGKTHILIVDDEEMIRSTLKEILENEGYKTSEAGNGEEAVNLLKTSSYDCVLLDIKMPKVDGLEVLEKCGDIAINTPFIMISGHGNEDTAFEAAKKGAFDFISKPPDLNRLLLTIRNAIDKKELIEETSSLKKKVTKSYEIIGESDEINSIKETIKKVAPTDARVLITGENGTGKELVARWLHDLSERANNTFIEVNCAAIPSELIESQLFGHEKGSFTSAHKQYIGKFEQANGGTLFLDEIGDMSLAAQAKVLRALQENKINRVGGDKDIKVDVRIVAATNKDLVSEISKGNFREDLYHRLSVILIHVPPLRERKDDIPVLSQYFFDEITAEYGKSKELQPRALAALKELKWTGNVRELRNIMERLVILSGDTISDEDVKNLANTNKGSKENLQLDMEKFKTKSEFLDYCAAEFDRLQS